MKVVKKTSEYTITQRRDGRYAVIGANKNPINGDEKAKILLAEELIKVTLAAAPEPEAEVAEEDAPAAEASADEAEQPAE